MSIRTNRRTVSSRLRCPLLATCLCAWFAPIAASQTVIVDNEDSGFTALSGTWTLTSATPGHWGTSYRYRNTSAVGASFGAVEFRPNLPLTGEYQVAAYYTAGGNRAIDAPFTIHYAGGTTTVPVNQQINGSAWGTLGTFSFDAGTGGYVTLTNDAGPNVVIADAIRFRSTAPAGPSFRAFWADAFHGGFKSQAEIDQTVARAVSGNYNAIIAEVLAYHDNVGSGHGAYWNSAIVPRATDIVGSFDPLEYLCTVAHAQGIEVHAWLVAFRVSTTWPPAGNALLAGNPEWFMVPQADIDSVHTIGRPTTVAGKYTLDPGSPDVQDYLASILREWTDQYDIDGVNWDYIRYVQTDAGYPADASYPGSTLARFKEISDTTSTPLPTGNTAWNDFRRRTLDEVIRRASGEVLTSPRNAARPVRHTGDMIGFGGPPSACDFTLTSAYALHQNWPRWIQQGWLDAAITMGYKREDCPDQAADYRAWVDCAVGAWRLDRHVYTGQGNYLNSLPGSFAQMQYAMDEGADGNVNFSYYATEAVYSAACGNRTTTSNAAWYDQVAAQVFTAPAAVPHMPWRDPATAGDGVIWGRVTDAGSGNSVDNATAQVAGFDAVQTDGNGYFLVARLPVLPACGGYTLTVTKAGSAPAVIGNISVLGGLIRRLDVTLQGLDETSHSLDPTSNSPGNVSTSAPARPGNSQGDVDGNGVVDLNDYRLLQCCLEGPTATFNFNDACLHADFNGDQKVDAADFALFQAYASSPG